MQGFKNALIYVEGKGIIKTNLGIENGKIAYIGDDIPDICVLKKVGLPCCPNDAVDEVKAVAKFVCSKNGGRGAVREVCDFILKETNKYQDIIDTYTNK